MGKLVAWWKLQDDLLDYSGQGNHLTDSGESYETGLYGNGLTMNANGATLALSAQSDDLINALSGYEMSFSIWWKSNYVADGTPYMWADMINWSDGTYTRRFERGNASTTETEADYWCNFGGTPLEQASGSDANIGDIYEWHNAIIVRRPAIVEHWIDGVLTWSSSAITDAMDPPTGQIAVNPHDSDSICNDIRIYDYALSPAEIINLSLGKMVHWKMDYNNGTAITDSSGYGHHGTMTTSPTLTTTEKAIGMSALDLNNGPLQGGTYMYVISDATVFIPLQGTLMAWIKGGVDDQPSPDNIYPFGYSYFATLGASSGTSDSRSGLIYYYDATTYESQTWGAQGLYDDTWHHYCIVWDGLNNTIDLYIDGVWISPQKTATDIWHIETSRYLNCGSSWTTSYGGHDGQLDDMRVYWTMLSATEVARISNSRAMIDNGGNLWL